MAFPHLYTLLHAYRLLVTQRDEGQYQHKGLAGGEQPAQCQDLGDNGLAAAGGGAVHQVLAQQYIGLAQALGLRRRGEGVGERCVERARTREVRHAVQQGERRGQDTSKMSTRASLSRQTAG